MTEILTPQEIEIGPITPTLEDLERYRDAWLSEAKTAGVINILFEAGSFLSHGDQPTYPYLPFDPSNAFRRLVCNNFVLHYNRDTVDGLVSGRTSWGIFEKIVITIEGESPFELIKGRQLANLYRGNIDNSYIERSVSSSEEAGRNKKELENFILPGDWWSEVLGPIREAIETRKEEAIDDEKEKERQSLINRLGLGV